VLLTTGLETTAALAGTDLSPRQVLDMIGRTVWNPLLVQPNGPVTMPAPKRIPTGQLRDSARNPSQFSHTGNEIPVRLLNLALVHHSRFGHAGILHQRVRGWVEASDLV
jgi:hypothetical protein